VRGTFHARPEHHRLIPSLVEHRQRPGCLVARRGSIDDGCAFGVMTSYLRTDLAQPSPTPIEHGRSDSLTEVHRVDLHHVAQHPWAVGLLECPYDCIRHRSQDPRTVSMLDDEGVQLRFEVGDPGELFNALVRISHGMVTGRGRFCIDEMGDDDAVAMGHPHRPCGEA